MTGLCRCGSHLDGNSRHGQCNACRKRAQRGTGRREPTPPPPRKSGPEQAGHAERRESAWRLRQQGLSAQQAAWRLGYSRRTIERYWRESRYESELRQRQAAA